MATPLPLMPNIYELTTFGTLFGKPCDHVTHWQIQASAGQEPAACTSLAQADVAQFVRAFGAELPPGYKHVTSRAVYLGSLTIPPATANAGFFGSEAGTRVPAFCAATIRHQSSVRGKGKDGRTNIPGPAIADIESADYYSLTTTAVNKRNDDWRNFERDLTLAVQTDLSLVTPPRFVIASRKTGTFQFPASSFCDPYLNTHRRWVKRLARHRGTA